MKRVTNIRDLRGHWRKVLFTIRVQRSRSYVYKCVNAITSKAYISTMWVWRRGSIFLIFSHHVFSSFLSYQRVAQKLHKQ